MAGGNFDAGDPNRQFFTSSVGPHATGFHTCCELEYQSGPATAEGHRIPGEREGRRFSLAGIRPECPADASPQCCEGNRPEAADELCVRARVPGINAGFARITRLSRPSDALALAVIEFSDLAISEAIEFLASALVPARRRTVSGTNRRTHGAGMRNGHRGEKACHL